MPCTPRPAEASSPRIDAYEELPGKNAKKFGCCQWVSPGTITRSMSASTDVERLGLGGRVLGQLGSYVAGLHRRRHRSRLDVSR
jgi:hypothetical protein